MDHSGSTIDIHDLRRDWVRGFTRVSAQNKELEREFEVICRTWSEPGRYYHNLTHLRQLLDWLHKNEARHQRPDLLLLVAFYHDIVYDSHSSTNEADSADRAREFMNQTGFPQNDITWVVDTINRTASHNGTDADAAQQYFLDADLAILGSSPEKYREYARNVRQEYIWVPEEQYRAGRSAILEKFLARERIYFTEDFHDSFEEQARENLKGEIKKLTNKT